LKNLLNILKIKNKLYMNRSSPKALPQHCGKTAAPERGKTNTELREFGV